MNSNAVRIQSSRSWLWLIPPVMALAGASVWWFMKSGDSAPSAPHVAANSAWPVVPSANMDEADRLMFSREPVGETRPADFSESDWDNLNKALANEPNKDKERNRVVSYLRFQRAVSKWSELSSGAASPERVALAQQLVAALPQHVANGEVNPGEALAVLTAVAIDIEPDAGRRTTWIEGQRARLTATESPEQAQALRAEQARNEQFAKEKAEITARWQNSPEAQRDPATLEAQLQALRERVYGSGSH